MKKLKEKKWQRAPRGQSGYLYVDGDFDVDVERLDSGRGWGFWIFHASHGQVGSGYGKTLAEAKEVAEIVLSKFIRR